MGLFGFFSSSAPEAKICNAIDKLTACVLDASQDAADSPDSHYLGKTELSTFDFSVMSLFYHQLFILSLPTRQSKNWVIEQFSKSALSALRSRKVLFSSIGVSPETAFSERNAYFLDRVSEHSGVPMTAFPDIQGEFFMLIKNAVIDGHYVPAEEAPVALMDFLDGMSCDAEVHKLFVELLSKTDRPMKKLLNVM